MAFITVAGQNLFAIQQAAEEPCTIDRFVLAYIPALGDEPIDRVETLPASEDIVDTRPVSRAGFVSPNKVVYTVALDSTLGPYDFNWVGLLAEDDTLVAVAYLAATMHKYPTDGGTQGNNLTRSFLLEYAGIQAITGIDVPADTWQIDFTARLLGIDERERLSNLDYYGHEAFYGNGFLIVRDSGSAYHATAGIGYVGGVRSQPSANIAFMCVPSRSVYLDLSLQGDITGVEVVTEIRTSATPLVDHVDSLGFRHWVTILADIASDGTVTDRRTIWSGIPPANQTTIITRFESIETDLDNEITARENLQAKVWFKGRYDTPGPISWTPPADCTQYILSMAAAGGGGEGGITGGRNGCGGGAGEFIDRVPRLCTPGVAITGSVGAGGAGGIGGASSGAGTNGGDTVFAGITLEGGEGASGDDPGTGGFTLANAVLSAWPGQRGGRRGGSNGGNGGGGMFPSFGHGGSDQAGTEATDGRSGAGGGGGGSVSGGVNGGDGGNGYIMIEWESRFA